jgi:predicted permease
MWSDLRIRMRAVFRRRTMEEDLDDELRFHFDREVEKLVGRGVELEEARRRARLEFGGLDPVKEECREARGVAPLDAAWQDLRYALRGMRRRPAFTLAAALTLGMGAAAVSTVFTLGNTLLLRELPVEHADRVVSVQATRRQGRAQGWVSYPDYVHFRDRIQSVEGLAAHYSNASFFVNANGQSREMNGAVVTANFFPSLGLKPALGRYFREDEDRVPDRDRVAVLSDELWRNWFGSSPEVMGAGLKINGVAFTVIGVAPPDFRGVTTQPVEVYIPMMMARAGFRWCEDALAAGCKPFDMIGRLRAGYTVEQARAEAATLVPQSWATAKEGENTGATVVLARGAMHPDLTRRGQWNFVRMLAGVAAVLLLVCCLNLAGLLISRNSARTREFSIRASLGAGWGRLMGQLVTESMLLAAGGGLLGIGFSLLLTSALNAAFFSVNVEGHPLLYNFTPEARVLVAVLAVSVAAGFLAGVVPAIHTIRANTAEGMKRQASTIGGARAGRWLAGAQVGVAVTLAAVAGVLAASARAMVAGVEYDSSHVALMRLRPRMLNYSLAQAQQFVRTVMDRLEAAPGVESASMAGNGAPLIGRDAKAVLPGWNQAQAIECGYIEIGPRYFETLRTRVLRGREFDRRDTIRSQPVAMVSESLALRLWPPGDVIGATLIVNGQPRQVVGVVKDALLQPRGEPVLPYAYAPFWQNPADTDARVLIRVRGDPATLLPALARVANQVDPDVPIAGTITLQQQTAGAISQERIVASLVSYAAILAMLLSAIGLYGSLAFAVSRRTKEIGIRMAVGAHAQTVLAMVMREGMTVVAGGSVAGVAGALAGTRVVRHLLYGPGGGDGQVYGAAVLVVLCAGLLACWVPARRAASVAPLDALREE